MLSVAFVSLGIHFSVASEAVGGLIGGYYAELSLFLPVLFTCVTVDQSVGIDSVSGLFFLGFSPPPSLGWPPVSPQSPVCFRVKQAILWAAALAAGSYCRSERKARPEWEGN